MLNGFSIRFEDELTWWENIATLPQYFWIFTPHSPDDGGCCLTFIFVSISEQIGAV